MSEVEIPATAAWVLAVLLVLIGWASRGAWEAVRDALSQARPEARCEQCDTPQPYSDRCVECDSPWVHHIDGSRWRRTTCRTGLGLRRPHDWRRFRVWREYADGTVDGFFAWDASTMAEAMHKRCRRCGLTVPGWRPPAHTPDRPEGES